MIRSELLHQTCYRLCIERIPNPYRLQLTSYVSCILKIIHFQVTLRL